MSADDPIDMYGPHPGDGNRSHDWCLDQGIRANLGYRAVMEWSGRIHSPESDRHGWACAVAEALVVDGPDVNLPPFPSRLRSTREARDETARRIFREANR